MTMTRKALIVGLFSSTLMAVLLTVGSVVGAAQTVSVGSGSLAVGDTIALSIGYDSAPQGLSGYIMTVSLTDGTVASIESVEFVAFSGASRAEISPDSSSVEIRATDFETAVGPGDAGITLARVTFRGVAEGSSEIILQLNVFDAEDGGDLLPSTTTQSGSLTVSATASPTVSLESGSVAIGNSAQIPLVLDRAPQGLSGYIMTVSLTNPTVAKIEEVEFVAFSDASRAEISSDGSSVEIRAADLGAAVGPGDTEITLARITFKGLSEGSSEIALQLNKFDADDGTDLLPSTSTASGTITVTTGISDTTPPQFANPQPGSGSTVGTNQPTISIEISDDHGVDPNSIQIDITDSGGTQHAFATSKDRGMGIAALPRLYRFWTPSAPSSLLLRALAGNFINLSVKAAVDLRAAGISLAEGLVTVTVSARDKAGNEGSTSWSFSVTASGDVTPPQFSNEQPALGTTVSDDQPIISVAITDAESGVDHSSIQLRIENNGVGNSFALGSPGAGFDSGVLSVDLRAAGITLVTGQVAVEVNASDSAGNLGSISWSFSVEPMAVRPGDVNGDGIVTRKDVDLVSKFVFTGRGLDEAQRKTANVARPCGPPDDRSTINFKDVTHLTQAAVGIRKEFECFPGVAMGSSSSSRTKMEEPLKVAKIAAYPNPVVSMDTAHFVVEGQGIAGTRVEVFDLSGRQVFDSDLVSGNELAWHLMNDRGEALANGVYLYIVTIRGWGGDLVKSELRKLVVLRLMS